MSRDLTEAERLAGLSHPLPPAEQIMWQAKPDARAMTRSVFHLRGLAIYFTVAAAIVFVLALHAGRPAGQALAEVTLLLPFAAIGFGLLSLLGRASARASVYTLTNRRIILHIGVAFEMTISIPLSAITNAALRRRGAHGDIALRVRDRGDTNYIGLWPHVRAWHWFAPQPMLRGLSEPERVVELMGDVLTDFNAAPRTDRLVAEHRMEAVAA